LESQRAFRTLLEALARPGETLALGDEPAFTVALTLLDGEVTFAAPGDGAFAGRVSRATRARPAPLPEADFVFLPAAGAEEGLRAMKQGTLEAPEEGATAMVLVESLKKEGGDAVLELSGPGVAGRRTLGVVGLPAGAVEAIRESRSGYPLGVDVFLLDGAGRVAGLPRSTRVGVAG